MPYPFEYDPACYPIGYMLNGECTVKGPTYDVVDMRYLDVLYSTALSVREIAPVVQELNERLRAEVYEDDFDLIKVHAEDLCNNVLGISLKEAAVTTEITPVVPETIAENSGPLPVLIQPTLATINIPA